MSQQQTYFQSQRELLLREIDLSFSHVLANINKLNRGLEGVIDVGNEFSSVEALWSQFENVMSKEETEKGDGNGNGNAAESNAAKQDKDEGEAPEEKIDNEEKEKEKRKEKR